MAKIIIQCPDCGEELVASTSFFSRSSRVVQCKHCGKMVDVKQERMESAACPSCGTNVVFKKSQKTVTCPDCKRKFAPMEEFTKQTRVSCPQCGCGIGVSKKSGAGAEAECPLCGFRFNAQAELERAKLVRDNILSVIKYEGDNSTFVWKHPIEDFYYGSKLIVHESQEALFLLNGKALDLFGPGEHILETQRLPLLNKVQSLPTGGANPFHAEVYFINKAMQMDLKWGTSSRVRFIDPITQIPLDIGASGEMNLMVGDARKLIVKLVGTTGGLVGNKAELSGEGARAVKSLQVAFRGMMNMEIRSFLGSVIKEQELNILEIDAHTAELSEALRLRIAPGFEEYGLELHNFYITSVSLPEDDKNFQSIRQQLADAYIKVREQQIAADIEKAKRGVELEKKQTELDSKRYDAEIRRIDAESEANEIRARGHATAEVMHAQGYNQRDVIQAEVQKAYAEGLGKIGSAPASGGGSASGGIAGDIVGMMVGMKAAEAMGGIMQGMNPTGDAGTPKAEPAAESGWTCSCGHKGNRGKFCEECGNPRPESWDCPCGHKGNRGKFCEECGKPKPESWDCPCGHKGNRGKCCEECGRPKPESAWTCSCGHAGNHGKCCEECGKPRS